MGHTSKSEMGTLTTGQPRVSINTVENCTEEYTPVSLMSGQHNTGESSHDHKSIPIGVYTGATVASDGGVNHHNSLSQTKQSPANKTLTRHDLLDVTSV